MIALSWILIWASGLAFCLALPRHRTDLRLTAKQNPLNQRSWRLLGAAGLLVALWLCMDQAGISIGVVYFLGLFSSVVFFQALVLAWQPRLLLWLAGVWPVLLLIGVS